MSLSWQQATGIDSNHLESIFATSDINASSLVNPQIQNDLKKLLAQAKNDGVEISIVSSFRDFDKQLAIWNDKWLGYRPVYSKQGRPLNIDKMSSIEKYKSIALWSAIPGLSRHHWGTDLDIFSTRAIQDGHHVELIPSEFSENGVCSELNDWLNDNLKTFGFFRPYQSFNGGVAVEPWHISHIKESQSILEQFDFYEFRQHLIKSDICERAFIVEKLPHYKEKYFLNINQAAVIARRHDVAIPNSD